MIERARYLAYATKEKAYALGRRSSLARALIACLRENGAADLTPPDFIADEFAALAKFLRDAGCTFHSCGSLGHNPMPRGVSFRYDVHVRDIAGAHDFAEAHRAAGIPATFFVLWDYSVHERCHLQEFQELTRKLRAPLELGLHDSPVDASLIHRKFGGDRALYWRWLHSDNAVEWLRGLASDAAEANQLNELVLEDFAARVRRTKEQFGQISTIAAHGGELQQAFRDRLQTLDPAAKRVLVTLFAPAWLTPRVAIAGLDSAVDNFNRDGAHWRQVTDGGGTLIRMVTVMQQVLKKNMAVQLLLHPFTWHGGSRDGEFCRLLAQEGAVRLPARARTRQAWRCTCAV